MTVEHSEYVKPELARKILVRWANLEIWRYTVATESSNIGATLFFAEELPDLIRVCPRVFQDERGIELANGQRGWILGISEHLKAAWDAPTPDERDWYIFKVRDLYARTFRASLKNTKGESRMDVEPPPPRTAFDNVLRYFLSVSRNALRCTRKGCRTPYFLKTKGARTQRYCETCGVLALHDRQNRYWKKTGKKLRQNKPK